MTRDDVTDFINAHTQLLDETAGEYIDSIQEVEEHLWDVVFNDGMRVRFEFNGYKDRDETIYYMM